MKWAEFQGAAPLFQAVQAGAADTSYSADLPSLQALSGGVRVKNVAALKNDGSHVGIVVRKDSSVRSVEDLKGKKVVVSSAKGSIAEYLLANVLQRAGLSYSDVNVQYLLPTDAQAAFASGKVDVWATFGVYQAVALHQGGRLLVDGDDGRVSGYGFIGASDKALADKGKQAALVDFLGRLSKALAWGRSHPQEYADAIEKDNGAVTRHREDPRHHRLQGGAADHAGRDEDRSEAGRHHARHQGARSECRGRRFRRRPPVHQVAPSGPPVGRAHPRGADPPCLSSSSAPSTPTPRPTAIPPPVLASTPTTPAKFARALDDGGFDYTLVAYHSASPDALQLAQFVAQPHRTPEADARPPARVSSSPPTRPAPSPPWTSSAAAGCPSTSSPAATTRSSAARATIWINRNATSGRTSTSGSSVTCGPPTGRSPTRARTTASRASAPTSPP